MLDSCVVFAVGSVAAFSVVAGPGQLPQPLGTAAPSQAHNQTTTTQTTTQPTTTTNIESQTPVKIKTEQLEPVAEVNKENW